MAFRQSLPLGCTHAATGGVRAAGDRARRVAANRGVGFIAHQPVRWSGGRCAVTRSATDGKRGVVRAAGSAPARVLRHPSHTGHLCLPRYGSRILDTQTALAGATGWWWAFDNVCVMSERPGILQTEPLPGAVHNERRLHGQNEPAVQFADGRSVHVDHGTIVPEWVIAEPTVERIARERNIEVRRCAIERIGWDVYIDEAGLELVDRTDDPGNAGAPLSLYATPTSWVDDGGILLVVNGSVDRDGRRRRYGLPVPNGMTSALDAAGWTYGITGDDYSCLVRRT
ncbi:DUF6745 domain-containing protein [Rhodococcus sp. UNC23MFCrub1.1]|uniref:DUF6745 domain-containing protein n=1 Tax=Rhodococcus sp. UNC23MFCrub1.1 TaxID=1449068 RepID=UPI002F35AF6C